MSTVVSETTSVAAFADPKLAKAVMSSVDSAMKMCGMATRCVGLAGVPGRDSGSITGMIGVHGKVSGFITVNMPERFAMQAVSGLLQEPITELNSQVVDGAGEITNIVVGGIKSALSGTNYAFTHITVPSVIVGHGYHLAFARGLEFLCTTFENLDENTVLLDDRLLQVSLSLLRL